MRRGAIVPQWLVVIGWILAAYAWTRHGVAPILRGDPAVDFRVYYAAAERVAHGLSPYEGSDRFLYVYPIFTAAALAPFTRWSVDAIETAWRVISLACAVLIVLMARGFKPGEKVWEGRSAPRQGDAEVAAGTAPPTLNLFVRQAISERWLLVCALAVGWFSPGFAHVMRVGQIELIIGALAMAMTVALLRGREPWAGVALAPALLIKPTAFPAVILAALWRKPKMIAAAAALIVIYIIAIWAAGLLPFEARFWREIAPQIAWEKRGISHSLARALAPESREAFGAVGAIVTLGLLGAYSAVMFGMKRRGLSLDRAAEFTLIAAPLISPLFEPHHLTMALPALILQLKRWAEGRMRPEAAVAIAAGWIMVFPFVSYYELLHAAWPGSYYLTLAGGFVIAAAVAVEALAPTRFTKLKAD